MSTQPSLDIIHLPEKANEPLTPPIGIYMSIPVAVAVAVAPGLIAAFVVLGCLSFENPYPL